MGCRFRCRGAPSAARCSAASAGGAGEAQRRPGDPQAIGGGRGGKNALWFFRIRISVC